MKNFFLVLVCCCWWQLAAAQSTYTVKVIKVVDGDTFHAITQQQQSLKIRMQGIDAPEKKQAYYEKSKQTLAALIFGQTVVLKVEKKDRYGRLLADVYVGQVWVNKRMIELGMAWRFDTYSQDPILLQAQNKAKGNQLGLWKDSNAMAPWDFRKRHK